MNRYRRFLPDALIVLLLFGVPLAFLWQQTIGGRTVIPAENLFQWQPYSALAAQVNALAKYQDAGGLWHTLLDDPGSYLEASATAGFAYGMLKSMRKRYLGREFEPHAVKAIGAVLANISPRGELKNVSFGTAMGSDLDFYRKIPLTAMPYGQAMAMLALGEFAQGYV